MSIQLYSSPMKYKDPNTGNYTNIIGISGNPGRGIASVELNNDYTLTITFTDGTSTTTSSIRGNGIESIEKTSTSGLIDTYTITDSDSNTYTFEVTNGDVPNLTIGTVTEGEEASATITGSRENPVLNLVLPLPSLTNYVKKTDYANGTNTGVIRVNNNYGLTNVDASDGGVGRTTYTAIMAPTTAEIRTGADRYKPIVPRNQHEASFYGLAKAAGDTTQAQSSNAVGTYTAGAKAAIQAMLDVPSNAEMQQAIDNINTMKIHICTSEEYDAQTGVPTVQNPDAQTFYLVPGGESSNLFIEWVYVNSAWERFGSADVEVPVQDVQVNSVSVVDANGVANVPVASTTNFGTIKIGGALELNSSTNALQIKQALPAAAKNQQDGWRVMVPVYENAYTFYGLASASGDITQKTSDNTVGNYTPEAKSAIQSMLGVSDLLAPRETSYIASQAYTVGDIFTLNGKLYKVTTAIAESGAIVVQDDGETVSGANAVQCKLGEETIKDVRVNGVSVLNNGVANVPIADYNVIGVVKINAEDGLTISTSSGRVAILKASSARCKSGSNEKTPIVPYNQHEAAFYGLAKAAGDTTQSQSSNAVGTYTDSAKAAIQHMLGTDTNLADYESDTTADAAYAIGELFMLNGKLHQATAAIAIGDTLTVGTNCSVVNAADVFPHDVKIDGSSIVSNGVAEIPVATGAILGLVRSAASNGIYISPSSGNLQINKANSDQIKAGTAIFHPIVPYNEYEAAFYGLAKAAGDTTQSASSNAVGTYTDNAKASIKSMLGIVDGSTATVTVTGTTPSITAVENTRYTCGEVSTLTITPPASGICIVRFTSGSTPTVLTATGVVWPAWFDATDLEADTIYEICITDGYGAVMSWAL